jgi:biotin operon repressor
MADTTSRILRLLSLLQTHRDWSGRELAERLRVSPRTIRRDIERLRDLGYPVHASAGVPGGYRLQAGASVPPLLLDDEEAVAIAVGPRSAAGGSVANRRGVGAGPRQAGAGAAGRLSRRVNALQTYTVPIAGGGPTVDPETGRLVELPAEDAAAYAANAITSNGARYQAVVTFHAPLEQVADRIRPQDGRLEDATRNGG